MEVPAVTFFRSTSLCVGGSFNLAVDSVTFSQGLAIGNSETIRSVHNGFSRQEPFFNDGKDDGGKKEDAFHFVAYLPHGEKVSGCNLNGIEENAESG